MSVHAAPAAAQEQAHGFAVERFYPSAPGGGWFVMDALDLHGGLGAAVSFSTGYAYRPLVVTDGAQHLAVVAHEAFTDVAAAVTYGSFRLYLNLTSPAAIRGQSGTVGGYTFFEPGVDAGNTPDVISDVRIGYDVRLAGDGGRPFRLGVGGQLIIPNGNRADYDTDNTFRAMLRALFAGDVGMVSYAAQIGAHIRPLDEAPTPGSPQGSELLFGAAAGGKFALGRGARTTILVGPEIYGETALQSIFGLSSTGVEGLLTARVEHRAKHGAQVGVKVGAGGGIDPHFGAPAARAVLAIELVDHGDDSRVEDCPEAE